MKNFDALAPDPLETSTSLGIWRHGRTTKPPMSVSKRGRASCNSSDPKHGHGKSNRSRR